MMTIHLQLRACSDAASKDLGHIAGSAAVQSSLHQQLQAWTRSTVLEINGVAEQPEPYAGWWQILRSG